MKAALQAMFEPSTLRDAAAFAVSVATAVITFSDVEVWLKLAALVMTLLIGALSARKISLEIKLKQRELDRKEDQ